MEMGVYAIQLTDRIIDVGYVCTESLAYIIEGTCSKHIQCN
jgi:hypothetical protein